MKQKSSTGGKPLLAKILNTMYVIEIALLFVFETISYWVDEKGVLFSLVKSDLMLLFGTVSCICYYI